LNIVLSFLNCFVLGIFYCNQLIRWLANSVEHSSGEVCSCYAV
jgi:hypothetical protein